MHVVSAHPNALQMHDVKRGYEVSIAFFSQVWIRVSFRGGIRPPLKTFCPPLENSKFQFQCLASIVNKITLTPRSASNFCKLQLVIEKYDCDFYLPRLSTVLKMVDNVSYI